MFISGFRYALALCCLIFFSGINHANAESYKTLQNIKQALELELQYVRENPAAYYLVIDMPQGEIYLKADANLLRTCPIKNTTGTWPDITQPRTFKQRMDPFTQEPGNAQKRLRGRLLPLDFFGRLVEGSRNLSRLYFTPSLLIQAIGSPSTNLPTLWLDETHVKALGAALQPGTVTILIPADGVKETLP